MHLLMLMRFSLTLLSALDNIEHSQEEEEEGGVVQHAVQWWWDVLIMTD